jgi:hypothetical protein
VMPIQFVNDPFTGNSGKHAEFEPVRHVYVPVRRQRCAHCAHPFLPTSATPTRLLDGRPGGSRFRSNVMSGALKQNRPAVALHGFVLSA